MKTLTAIRDLIYQERYSESYRVSYSKDSITTEYLKQHSKNTTLAQRKVVWLENGGDVVSCLSLSMYADTKWKSLHNGHGEGDYIYKNYGSGKLNEYPLIYLKTPSPPRGDGVTSGYPDDIFKGINICSWIRA